MPTWKVGVLERVPLVRIQQAPLMEVSDNPSNFCPLCGDEIDAMTSLVRVISQDVTPSMTVHYSCWEEERERIAKDLREMHNEVMMDLATLPVTQEDMRMVSSLPRNQARPDGLAGSNPVSSAMIKKALTLTFHQGDFAKGQRTFLVTVVRVGTFAS